MTIAPTIDDRTSLRTGVTGRGTDPLRPFPDVAAVRMKRPPTRKTLPEDELRLPAPLVPISPAALRQRAQLPPFAPLLEELEIAGWSSHRRLLSGNFHDWMLLGGERILVVVGHAAVAEANDATEAALVAQAMWAAVRAHAPHASDAGEILSLVSQTLWATPAALPASVAVALVDAAGGNISVALAGDCLAWRVRAATCEKLAICQPQLGNAASFSYRSQSFQLALRERLILLADDGQQRSRKTEALLAARFSQLDAEAHRRMAAADAVALVRQDYEHVTHGEISRTASIAAVRRR